MLQRRFGSTDVPVPVIGQGTWNMGDTAGDRAAELRALRLGIELGLTHIDTAEMYGNGRAESLIREAVAGLSREKLFLVSKVLPSNGSARGVREACDRSLRHLGTEYLDVYLMHWWSTAIPIEETMQALESLIDAGKVRAIGVSNFSVKQLQRAERALSRHRIVCNQVLYHLRSRGIEFALIPYCESRDIAVVAYSPFGQGNFPEPASSQYDALRRIAARHDRPVRQIALSFLVRRASVFAIPKASSPDHVRENASGVVTLGDADLDAIDRAFPPPRRDEPLDML